MSLLYHFPDKFHSFLQQILALQNQYGIKQNIIRKYYCRDDLKIQGRTIIINRNTDGIEQTINTMRVAFRLSVFINYKI
jgi:hypothetical protein